MIQRQASQRGLCGVSSVLVQCAAEQAPILLLGRLRAPESGCFYVLKFLRGAGPETQYVSLLGDAPHGVVRSAGTHLLPLSTERHVLVRRSYGCHAPPSRRPFTIRTVAHTASRHTEASSRR